MAKKAQGTAKRTRSTRIRPTTKSAEARSASIRQASVSGAKPFYGSDDLSAVMKIADGLPTMESAGLIGPDRKVSGSPIRARARREWCEKIGAPLIAVWDVAHPNKIKETDGVGTISDRPENAIRSRLASWCRGEGLPEDYYYAVRSEAYTPDEIPTVYVVRKTDRPTDGDQTPAKKTPAKKTPAKKTPAKKKTGARK